MLASTATSASNVVPLLDNILNSNDSLSKLQAFTPINSMLEWNNKLQKMLNVIVLSHSGIYDKRMSKVTVSVCNTKLQLEMLWPSIMADTDKLHTYWRTNKISLSDTIIEGFNTFF